MHAARFQALRRKATKKKSCHPVESPPGKVARNGDFRPDEGRFWQLSGGVAQRLHARLGAAGGHSQNAGSECRVRPRRLESGGRTRGGPLRTERPHESCDDPTLLDGRSGQLVIGAGIEVSESSGERELVLDLSSRLRSPQGAARHSSSCCAKPRSRGLLSSSLRSPASSLSRPRHTSPGAQQSACSSPPRAPEVPGCILVR